MVTKIPLSLQNNNSFNIAVSSPDIYFVNTYQDLELLPELSERSYYILGDGTNSLFVDSIAPIIIKPDFKGITISETEDYYRVTAGAGENWHQLVVSCIKQGINGLENLALIPGSVGAAPVQNIGAYGVELADFCEEVCYFDLLTKECKTLVASDCQFAYRDSIFKHSLHNRAVITEVTFLFPKAWQANINYSGLNELAATVDAQTVMDKVIKIRKSKLPDPKELPNAGSFFKNPVIENDQFTLIQAQYPDIPHYPQADGNVKLAAGWLIEKSGLKGFRLKNVGVHERQALVLVNYANGSGQDIIDLAQHVQQQVFNKFSIKLAPEVRIVLSSGETSFEELCGDGVHAGKSHE